MDEYDQQKHWPGLYGFTFDLRSAEQTLAAEMANHIHTLAEKIWQYHQMKHQLEKADVILVLCSHDKKVAERGAQLFLDGWAPLLIFAGGLGSITRGMWDEPEADQFAEIAIGMGVPSKSILIENQSTNTGENVLFTRQLLAEKQIDPQKFILVQKPYMERRSLLPSGKCGRRKRSSSLHHRFRSMNT